MAKIIQKEWSGKNNRGFKLNSGEKKKEIREEGKGHKNENKNENKKGETEGKKGGKRREKKNKWVSYTKVYWVRKWS